MRVSGYAALQCGKATPYRSEMILDRGCASVQTSGGIASEFNGARPVRHSLTALEGGIAEYGWTRARLVTYGRKTHETLSGARVRVSAAYLLIA